MNARRSGPAAVVRRVARAVARAGSSSQRPHHAAYLDDLAEHEQPVSTRDELVAASHHLGSLLRDAGRTPALAVLGVFSIAIGVVGAACTTAPSSVDPEPVASIVQQALQVMSLVPLAAALLTSSLRRARRLFLAWLVPCSAAAIGYFFIDFGRSSGIMVGVDVLIAISQSLMLVGVPAFLIGLRGGRTAFVIGWSSVTAALAVYAGADLLLGLNFALRGEQRWVMLTGATTVGLALTASAVARSIPNWWRRPEPVVDQRPLKTGRRFSPNARTPSA